MSEQRILVINPGSTSTKLALYEGAREVWCDSLPVASPRGAVADDLEPHLAEMHAQIVAHLRSRDVSLDGLAAIAGRGGALKPLASGTYRVDARMCADVLAHRVQDRHAANLGAVLAHRLATEARTPAFIVDPVSADDLADLARITGHPRFPKASLTHALSAKAAARRASEQLRVAFEEGRWIAVHIGGGTSVNAIEGGRIVDVLVSRKVGPFGTESAGSLATGDVVRAIAAGEVSASDARMWWFGEGGLRAHLGTDDLRVIAERVRGGDVHARVVVEAMAYQLALACGAMSMALSGAATAVVVTGDAARSTLLRESLEPRLARVARQVWLPGQLEMEALARGALRALTGEEPAREYPRDDD